MTPVVVVGAGPTGLMLAGELRLFVIALKPEWTLARMAEHHDRLIRELESEGPPALRRHLDEGAGALLGG